MKRQRQQIAGRMHCVVKQLRENVLGHRLLIAGDRQAYRYLSDTVRQFVPPEKVSELLEQCGFEQVTLQRFLFGAVCLHVANKPHRK